MEFSVECSCGRRLIVGSAEAGTTVACECGAPVAVPSLGKLRELAGRGAYEAGTVDTIIAMIKRGALPAGSACAVSGAATNDVIDLYVEAERIYVGSDRSAYAWLGLLISPILFAGLFQKPRPDVGRETIVPAPLRVAARHHLRVRRASQRALKRWLRSVPVYAQLLEEYPRARVHGKRPAGRG
jgi:hypothetical protein